MDLSDEETSSTSSSEIESSSSSEEDDSKNGPSKRARFLSTYRRNQDWSLPESIIYYMAMNPKNAKVYEKLVHSCKYFFVKNPILVADRFDYDRVDGKWIHFVCRGRDCTKFSSVSSKFWITKEFTQSFSSILSKFYRVDVKELNISNQHISLDDFVFLASNVKYMRLWHTTVKNADSSIVPFEKLVKLLPKLNYIEFFNDPKSSSITSNTVKELLELPHFSKIVNFRLSNICELFDINTFFAYMKKIRSTKFYIYFCPPLSEAFKIRLEEMIDEIIKSKICGINLNFYGLDEEKHLKIRSLFEASR
uniref:Uncharacterized protein n=1 Tax=Panagrolaimus sp. ES5 TaxID=591445 RepID=A0AC34G5E2_9BILA